MTYDLGREIDRERFSRRAEQLLSRGSLVALEEKVPRTTGQNAYLHLAIGAVALEVGVDAEYAKREYFKRLANAPLFVRSFTDPVTGRKAEVLRSSADVSKEEMSEAIDRFKRWAAENGIYIPEPEDEARLRDIAVEMERNRRYL